MQDRRAADHFFKHRTLTELFTERDVLVTKLLFSLLAILNVGRCYEPSCYVPLFIFKWISADKKPAKLAVVSQQPNFEFMRRLFERSVFSFGKIPLTIIWMDKINSRLA